MPKTIEEPATFIEAVLRTATTQLVVRTLLSVSGGTYGHFSTDIFMAEGHVAGTVERALYIRANKGSSQTPVRLSDLKIVPGTQASHLIADWFADMTIRHAEDKAPWFKTWLTHEEFVGVVLLSSSDKLGTPLVHRRIPAHHAALQVYFGAISASLSFQAQERKERNLNQDERNNAALLNRLAERFGRFMWQQQRVILDSVMGSGQQS
ncbi:MAG: hypothetical protein JWL82_581 [Parcubacteria group bacterium]|nr:hypothetical protein [Parcubacteria group bacterium]